MIFLNRIAKRFQGNWVFKEINYVFEPGQSYALIGNNGSGKSTLLRIVAGIQGPTLGKVRYELNGTTIPPEKIFKSLSYCAPGLELVEEMTLTEFLQFHFSFKPKLKQIDTKAIIGYLGLESAAHRFLHEFSSGMLQRVKLAQAFFSDTPILLLDEPCSNLDLPGFELYARMLHDFGSNRLIIIASNDSREYPGVEKQIRMEDYKTT